jgi:hypothetical protein
MLDDNVEICDDYEITDENCKYNDEGYESYTSTEQVSF